MERRCFISNEEGASSAEFALVIVPFVSIFMIVLGFSVMLWTSAALRYAVEDAARCAAVKTSVCTDKASTENYALSRYEGPALSPAFSYFKKNCTGSSSPGNRVIGEVQFPLNTGLINLSFPLTATACFPS